MKKYFLLQEDKKQVPISYIIRNKKHTPIIRFRLEKHLLLPEDKKQVPISYIIRNKKHAPIIGFRLENTAIYGNEKAISNYIIGTKNMFL